MNIIPCATRNITVKIFLSVAHFNFSQSEARENTRSSGPPGLVQATRIDGTL